MVGIRTRGRRLGRTRRARPRRRRSAVGTRTRTVRRSPPAPRAHGAQSTAAHACRVARHRAETRRDASRRRARVEMRETLGRTLCFTQRLCLVAGRDANPVATRPIRAGETETERPRRDSPATSSSRGWSEWLTEYFRAAEHPSASSNSPASSGRTRAVAIGSARGPSASVDGPPRTRTIPTVPPRALDSRRRRRSSPSRCYARSSTIGPRLIFYTPPTCRGRPRGFGPGFRQRRGRIRRGDARVSAGGGGSARARRVRVDTRRARRDVFVRDGVRDESHALYVAHRLLRDPGGAGRSPARVSMGASVGG